MTLCTLKYWKVTQFTSPESIHTSIKLWFKTLINLWFILMTTINSALSGSYCSNFSNILVTCSLVIVWRKLCCFIKLPYDTWIILLYIFLERLYFLAWEFYVTLCFNSDDVYNDTIFRNWEQYKLSRKNIVDTTKIQLL